MISCWWPKKFSLVQWTKQRLQSSGCTASRRHAFGKRDIRSTPQISDLEVDHQPVNCQLHCGQLILRKMSEIGATRCKNLRPKCTKFNLPLGLCTKPHGEAFSAHPDLLAVFKRPTSNEKGVVKRRVVTEKGMGGEWYPQMLQICHEKVQ